MDKLTFTPSLTREFHLNYLRHLPSDYGQDPDRRWPLILFLHGRGESGDNLEAVRTQGLPRELAAGRDLPFIVLAPQCPWGTWWPELAEPLLALLDETIAQERVDRSRVYLTGLSMGGFGSWYLGSREPERFAAVVPVCGGGYWFHGFPDKVCALKNTPVWAFHGALDDVVPPEASEQLVDTLKECGGNVRYTVYPEANHDSWTETYANPTLYEWLLEQKL